jgi:hypothetical protein
MTLSGSISAAGGCTGAASFCNKAFLHTPPVQNPFALLDAVSLPTMANCPVDKKNPTLTAWSAANPCKNDSVSLTGGATITLCGSGVYFISGTLSLKGGSLIQTGSPTTTPPCSPASTTGTALFILLPDASLDTKGGGTINITGNPSVTASQLPTVLQPYAGLFAYMAIYDQSGAAVTFGGNSNINLTGNIYAPAAAVTFQGNPTIDVGNGKRCGELIAASVAFNGNATLDSSGCPLIQQVPNPPQYVQLVQ